MNQNVERVGRGAYEKLGDRGASGWTGWPNEPGHCNDKGAVRAMIRLKPDELETVAKHIPDAEDACERARTTLSRELSSLAMDLPGVSTPAIEALRDELVHWLRRYEDKLNEAEELLYRTAAAMRQADQTLADNMKEFGLELLGWYDVQRVFGEYDPITGERLSLGDRLLAGGMLLASIFPPAKGAGMARKVAIKGAKAMEAASILSKMKHVVRYDKIKVIFETIYRQVVKAPFAETARLFKKQWDDLVESVSVVGWKPVYVGVGPTSRVWMNEARNEVKDATLHMMKKIEGEAIDSIPKSSNSSIKDTGKNAIKNVKFYSTRIDNQVEEIEKMPLPQTIAATFKDSNYRTVITKENITVYRAFGGHADAGGTFATTSPAVNRIHTKIDLALLPEWKNTRNYEAVIEVPKGTILNIGRAEQQMTKTGSILKGDADQILLPLNYPLEWIKEIRRIPSK